jgi:hypothetical protein
MLKSPFGKGSPSVLAVIMQLRYDNNYEVAKSNVLDLVRLLFLLSMIKA